MKIIKSLTLVVLLISILARAEEIKTDLLEPVQGFTGDMIGATVAEIEEVNGDGGLLYYKLAISVPEAEISDENIQVLSQSKTVITPKKVQVIRDYDEGRTGVILYLPKKVPFYLNFQSASEIDKSQ